MVRPSFIVLLAGFLFLTDNPLHSEDLSGATLLSHGNIQITIPGKWETGKERNAVVAKSQKISNTILILTGLSDLRTWGIKGYLVSGMESMEKNEQRTIVKTFPPSVAEGFTANGTGFAFQSRITKNSANQLRYAAYYAFSVGARFQTVILLTDSAEKLSSLMKQMTSAFDSIQVRLPEKQIASISGRSFSYFNYSFLVPAQWSMKESPYTNLTVFEPDALPGSKYVFGISNPFRVEFELQPSRAISPIAALESFLTKRSTHQYKSWRKPEYALKVSKIEEIQLPDGRILTGLALQQTNDDRFYLGAWLLNGADSSIIVSAGFKLHKYDLIKRGSTAQIEHNAFYSYFEQILPQLLAATKWNLSVKRNPGAENQLLQKKVFSYRRESAISSGSISVFSSNKIDWEFFGDRKAKYKVDKFTSFNDYEYNPATNRNEVSSGYLTADQNDPDNRFEVWDSQTGTYIILKRPGGVATFHALTLSPRYTIDGFEHGCCR